MAVLHKILIYSTILHGGFSCLPFGGFSQGYAAVPAEISCAIVPVCQKYVVLEYINKNYVCSGKHKCFQSVNNYAHLNTPLLHPRPGATVMRHITDLIELKANIIHRMLRNESFKHSVMKWANTNEDELDWTTLQALPDPEKLLSGLDVENNPDPAAGVLASQTRPGWEGGQLISDPLPCVSSGIRVTATAWKTHFGPPYDNPKLQVCTKNVNEVKFPLINCNEFDVRNGVPVTVEVPAANNPNQPAQIVFYGNNFVSTHGGAIFLQDILVEGSLSCSGETLDSHPVLINGDPLQRDYDEEPVQQSASHSNISPVGPLKAIEGLSKFETAVDDGSASVAKKAPRKPFTAANTIPDYPFDVRPLSETFPVSQNIAVVAPTVLTVPTSATAPISSSLFESCLELSCNPSDLSCKFWRSGGSNRWEIGTSGRLANPLTGIQLPPEIDQKFLVAPFLDPNIKSYTLVSESLSIPSTDVVYFCFYEYFATQGLSLSVCTDSMECFYKRTSLRTGNAVDENKKWNMRCTILPSGKYELRVIAENLGENKGELGFLPIRLARDSAGQQLIC